MIKRFVYHAFIAETTDDEKREIIHLHMLCIKYFEHVFDEAVIYLSKGEKYDVEIYDMLNTFFHSLDIPNITVIDDKNDPYLREAICFKNEVVDKRDENVLTFFYHLKGVSSIYCKFIRDVFPNTKEWIMASYFLNLNYMDEVCWDLLAEKPDNIFFGALPLFQNSQNRYRWFYAGTSFWTNNRALDTYIENNKLDKKYIEIYNRWFGEWFPGNILDRNLMRSHGNKYVNDDSALFHASAINLVNYYFTSASDYAKFNTFKDQIKEDLKNKMDEYRNGLNLNNNSEEIIDK